MRGRSTVLSLTVVLLAWSPWVAAQSDSEMDGPGGRSVTFAFDSAALDDQDQQFLDELSEWLLADDARQVVLAGHTDSIGAAEYNALLAERRAEAVRLYLVENGVPAERIEVVSFGEWSQPAEAAADNRSVVVHVAGEGPPDAAGEEVAAPPEPEIEPERPVEHSPGLPPVAAPELEPAPGPERRGPDRLRAWGASVSVGAGLTGFLDSDTRDFTDPGVAWDARLVVGTRTRIGGEAAYIGRYQDIAAIGLDEDAALVGNGAEAGARVNLLRGDLTPYVFGGLGWTRYDIIDADFNTSSLDDQEDAFLLPLALGASYHAGELVVDLRGTIRPTIGGDLTEDTGLDAPSTSLDHWEVGLRLGWAFD